MLPIITSFGLGMLFGVGLSVSEMTDPARVLGFLDVTGQWDATLLFVMAGALLVTVPTFPLVLKRRNALLGDSLALPTYSRIDFRLLLGAAIFGIGWGLAGLCPGPALANLASLTSGAMLFVIAMIAGQWLAGRLTAR